MGREGGRQASDPYDGGMELDPGYSNVRVGVKAIIVRGTSVLFNENIDVHGNRVFVLPGGGQEHGESQVEALKRECEEEIGAAVRVYDLACTFDLISAKVGRHRDSGQVFHQQNLLFWCDLEPGSEPRMGEGHDPHQVGVKWIEINDLHTVDVRPREALLSPISSSSSRRRMGSISVRRPSKRSRPRISLIRSRRSSPCTTRQ